MTGQLMAISLINRLFTFHQGGWGVCSILLNEQSGKSALLATNESPAALFEGCNKSTKK